MPLLPRSALLALWAGPVLAGRAEDGPLLRAVQGDDEPHEVSAGQADGLSTGPAPHRLPELLRALAEHKVSGLRLVLPVPGDPSELPGPAAVNEGATEAGECVVTVGGPPLVVVPQVRKFGSALEVGHQVMWHVLDCALPTGLGMTTVAEAERELREALARVTTELSDLDVSRWRPDAAVRLDGLRGSTSNRLIPTGTPQRAARVFDLAWRVWSIAALAREDHGGAVNGWEASQREQGLRQLESVSRRALVASVNAPLNLED